MAAKKYNIKQIVTVNGGKRTNSFSVYGSDSDVTLLVDTLEGAVEVMELNETLSKTTGGDTNVTSYNLLKKVTMYNEDKKVSAYLSPYSGTGIVVKNSKTADDFSGVFKQFTPWVFDASLKPTSVTVSLADGVVSQ